MGANTSLIRDGEEGPSSSEAKLDDMPESCVSLVLMHLDPIDICKFTRLSRAFRAPSSADFIWKSKLPSNCRLILQNVLDDKGMTDLWKKDVYARVCRPVSFDGGTKEIWVDKNTGGVCISILARR